MFFYIIYDHVTMTVIYNRYMTVMHDITLTLNSKFQK